MRGKSIVTHWIGFVHGQSRCLDWTMTFWILKTFVQKTWNMATHSVWLILVTSELWGYLEKETTLLCTANIFWWRLGLANDNLMILKLNTWYHLYIGISRLERKEEGVGVCQSGSDSGLYCHKVVPPAQEAKGQTADVSLLLEYTEETTGAISPLMIKQDWWENPDIAA